MARNYIQDGNVLEITAAAAIASGDIVQQGSFIGVALVDAAIGKLCQVHICGVFAVACPSADVITQGAPLYFDEAEAVVKLDDEAGANSLAGYAFRASGNGVTEVDLRLLF